MTVPVEAPTASTARDTPKPATIWWIAYEDADALCVFSPDHLAGLRERAERHDRWIAEDEATARARVAPPATDADWIPFIPEHVELAPLAPIEGGACTCTHNADIVLHVAGCTQGAAGQAQPYGPQFCADYGLTPNVLVTAAVLGAALRGISAAGLPDAMESEAEDRLSTASLRRALGPDLASFEAAEVEYRQGLAETEGLDPLFEQLRAVLTAAEYDKVLDGVDLGDTAAVRAHLQARLAAVRTQTRAALPGEVSELREAEQQVTAMRAMGLDAAADQVAATLDRMRQRPEYRVRVSHAAPSAVPPVTDFTAPPASSAAGDAGFTVPPAASAPTVPPAVGLDRELLEVMAGHNPDQAAAIEQAAEKRDTERALLMGDLAPFLLASTVPAQDQISALLRMTLAERDEVLDAAKAGRLTMLGLSICDLAAESRTAKQNWIRLRESAALVSRYIDGGSFIHNIPDTTPAVWGSGDDVLWAEGEGLIVAGPQGVGKSTMAGNLVAAMIIGGEFLGYPVKRVEKILYLAMDRPKQIARALRRQLGGIQAAELAQRLAVWQGPPPEDLAANPDRLLAMAEKAGASVIVVDSLKDAALGLASDEVGAGWNRARQTALAAGVEVLELHHDRKTSETHAPAIEKLYGSIWITSGAGSVIHLGGEPGDPVVRMYHLKQPASEVGPFDINHDGASGTMTIHDATDLLAMCRQPGGLSVSAAAVALYDVEKPTDAHREKARRRLNKLKDEGLVSAAVIGGATMYTAPSYTSFEVPGATP